MREVVEKSNSKVLTVVGEAVVPAGELSTVKNPLNDVLNIEHKGPGALHPCVAFGGSV